MVILQCHDLLPFSTHAAMNIAAAVFVILFVPECRDFKGRIDDYRVHTAFTADIFVIIHESS